MTDWSAFPMPANAPEPGACWRIERPEPGLVVLVLDPPHRPKLAVFDVPALRDLGLALDELERDAEARGLVITGRAPTSFAGGADVDTIAAIEDPALAAALVRAGQATFTRIERMSRAHGGRLFTVAAVGGPVPGGACEITLVCDRTVLADDDKTRIGLPEVRLGILPAWGGTSRLPRRIGVPAAAAAILSGKLHRPRAALKLGIVDRLTKPEYLVRIASDVALGRLGCKRKERGVWSVLIDRNPLAGMVIESRARKGVLAQTKGRYPAPLAALPLIVRAPRTPLDQALDREVKAIEPLVTSPVTQSLITLFQLSEEAKKLGDLPDGARAPRIERAAVVGAGVMGGAIASLMADKGIAARLADLDQRALDRAVWIHQSDVAKSLKKRRLKRHEADAAIDRLTSTRSGEGFARSEIVIEAVAEVLAVKRKVLALYAAQMTPDAILATNTSSLSVDAIAAELSNPERVVGMHFFNPVKKMPLVEIVRGARTSDAVVARTARLALDLGKTPVVCKDVAGFLVNRLLGPYLDEALCLWEAGAAPAAVDRALVDFGMPMGPFELLDEVGLDIATHAAESLHAAYGDRMVPSRMLAPLIAADHLGKKSGRGIFVWGESKGRLRSHGLNPEGPKPAGDPQLSAAEAVDRLVLAMLNEAARALEEEVVAGPRELDLATVFGMGFAPFRGGLLRYADTRGIAACAEALSRIASSTGVSERESGPTRFEPAPLLAALARDGGRFHR